MSSQPRPEQVEYALTLVSAVGLRNVTKKVGPILGWNQLWGALVILMRVFGV